MLAIGRKSDQEIIISLNLRKLVKSIFSLLFQVPNDKIDIRHQA